MDPHSELDRPSPPTAVQAAEVADEAEVADTPSSTARPSPARRPLPDDALLRVTTRGDGRNGLIVSSPVRSVSSRMARLTSS